MNANGCRLGLLGHLVTTHLLMPRSICAQSTYYLSLLSWGCKRSILSVPMARASAHAMVVMLVEDMLKLYLRLSFSNHLTRGSRNMRKR